MLIAISVKKIPRSTGAPHIYTGTWTYLLFGHFGVDLGQRLTWRWKKSRTRAAAPNGRPCSALAPLLHTGATAPSWSAPTVEGKGLDGAQRLRGLEGPLRRRWWADGGILKVALLAASLGPPGSPESLPPPPRLAWDGAPIIRPCRGEAEAASAARS